MRVALCLFERPSVAPTDGPSREEAIAYFTELLADSPNVHPTWRHWLESISSK